MSFTRTLGAGAAVAGFALVYYVRRRHDRTGEGYVSIVRGLPSDARRWAADVQRRGTQALEDGRQAAREREQELLRQLEAAAPPGSASAGVS